MVKILCSVALTIAGTTSGLAQDPLPMAIPRGLLCEKINGGAAFSHQLDRVFSVDDVADASPKRRRAIDGVVKKFAQPKMISLCSDPDARGETIWQETVTACKLGCEKVSKAPATCQSDCHAGDRMMMGIAIGSAITKFKK